MVLTDSSVASVWSQLQRLVSGKGKWEKEVMFQQIVSLLTRRTSRRMSFPQSADGHELDNICTEELFKYLLASERIRSERSGSSIQLLLVMLLTPDGKTLAQMDDGVAQNLYSVLKQCLRGTDYTGWYQDRFVLGAVLTAMRGLEEEEISRQVEKRFLEASQERLSESDWSKLRVRICQRTEVETGQVFLLRE